MHSSPRQPRRRATRRSHAVLLQTLESRLVFTTSAELLAAALHPTLVSLTKSAALKNAHTELFNRTTSIPANTANVLQQVNATSVAPFTLDWQDLVATLDSAPNEYSADAQTHPLIMALPRPDGTFERFEIAESAIMEQGLAAQFPDIKTFRGIGIDDPTASVRLDHTQLGFHAQVLSANGAYYIDPYYLNDAQGTYGSYFKSDAVNIHGDWDCVVTDDGDAINSPAASGALPEGAAAFGTQMKTYRAAVAATGEYTAAVGSGTVAGGQAAIVTAMNRVVGVYQTELDISMTLVANNSSLVYTNASTDPYTNNDGTTMLSQNQSTITSVIGSANYDIGHVFSTGGGGIASLKSVGVSSRKAQGVTGNSSPVGDSFTIDYVAHEMGHQFGANHTFNTSQDGNRNSSTAYEPGSGSTIMAYAGIEFAEDLQPHSDPYFHAISIDEIRSYIGTISSVGTQTATGNNPPTVSAGSDYTIPTGTPFNLTASGSDPDGDTLTYDWQEMDKGAAALLTTAETAGSTFPLFRDYSPTTSPTRTLPKLAGILNGSNVTTYVHSGYGTFNVERLYSVARTSNWRVIARDNKAVGGGVVSDDMVLNVVNTGASFAVTAPNAFTSVSGNSNLAVSWNVAGTTGSGINTANVKISLSTDGGNTFSTVLSASTANDGTETVTLPNISTTQARIKVEAVGNIFFDIGNANFTITAVTNSAVPGTPSLVAASDTGAFNNDRVTRLDNSIAANVLQFSVPGTVPAATVRIYSDGNLIGTATASGTTTTVTTNGSFDLTDGTHSITASQTEVSKTASTQSASQQITVDTIAPTILSSGFDYEAAQKISFKFSEPVNNPTLTGSNFTVTGIASGNLNVSYNGVSDAATLTYALNAGIFPDGNYNASVASAADLAGNAVSGSGAFAFSFLQADATGDKFVDTQDFNVLAANFGLSGGFSQGNFDYTGTVDSTDFDIFVAQYGKRLAPAAPLRPAAVTGPSLFSSGPVSSGDKEIALLA